MKLQDNVCVSANLSLSLKEYCFACEQYCLINHNQHKCTACSQMIEAANLVLKHGFYPLSSVFRDSFPGITYKSATAKRKLLQMPLAAITLGHPSSGKSEVYLLEAIEGLNYTNLITFLEANRCTTMSG